MKIYFKDLSGIKKHPKGQAYFIADCVNWCEEHIGKRDFLYKTPWQWDTIKPPMARFELMAPPSLGIYFANKEDALAFLLVFK